jgi:hypothetical protein
MQKALLYLDIDETMIAHSFAFIKQRRVTLFSTVQHLCTTVNSKSRAHAVSYPLSIIKHILFFCEIS